MHSYMYRMYVCMYVRMYLCMYVKLQKDFDDLRRETSVRMCTYTGVYVHMYIRVVGMYV
jgi:hypothetical protein